MTRYYFCHASCLLTLSLALTCLPATPGRAAPPSGLSGLSGLSVSRNLPDAFLPVPARSVAALVAQVQADPVVCRHYAHYLNLPPSRVASYLRANVVPSRLSHEGQYTVYFVRPNGLIYPTVLTVAKGSPVFALRNGPALLTWNDGNPLVRCQKTGPYDPYRQARPAPVIVPAKPPRIQQVIVPTRVETTVVPPLPPAPEPVPVTVEKTAGP